MAHTIRPSQIWTNAKQAEARGAIAIHLDREAFMGWIDTQPLHHPDFTLRLTTRLLDPDCIDLSVDTSAIVPLYVAQYLAMHDDDGGSIKYINSPGDKRRAKLVPWTGYRVRGSKSVEILGKGFRLIDLPTGFERADPTLAYDLYAAPPRHVKPPLKRAVGELGIFRTLNEAKAVALRHRAGQLEGYAKKPRQIEAPDLRNYQRSRIYMTGGPSPYVADRLRERASSIRAEAAKFDDPTYDPCDAEEAAELAAIDAEFGYADAAPVQGARPPRKPPRVPEPEPEPGYDAEQAATDAEVAAIDAEFEAEYAASLKPEPSLADMLAALNGD